MKTPQHYRYLAGLLLCVAAFVWLGREFELHLIELENWIAHLGAIGPLAFILLFTLLAPLFVSIDALCIMAGVLFPLLTGELAVIATTYLTAALIFYLGRHFVRDKAERLIAKHSRLTALNNILGNGNSLKLMFLLRLTPLPFALLSYALAVSKVRFWPYFLASSGTLLYNLSLFYVGFTAKHLTSPAAGNGKYPETVPHSLVLFGLLALIAVVILISNLAAKGLKHLEGRDHKVN